MNLAETITEPPPRKGPPCAVTVMLERLDDKERAALVEALANPSMTHAHLSRCITKAKLPRVGPGTISRHRNGDCACAL